MPQHLADHWYLEIDPSFVRRWDDSSIIFEKPGFELRAFVCFGHRYDSEQAIRDYFLEDHRPSEFPFQPPDARTAGHATLARTEEKWELSAVVASCGRMADLWFRLDARDDLEAALSIWNSVRYVPPEWIVHCADAVPPLAELCDALERDKLVPQAMETVLARGQTGAALRALLAALHSKSWIERKAACEALGLLHDTSPAVIAAVRERLGDESIEVRAWAADALLELGQSADTLVPTMIEGLQKQESPLPAGEARINGPCRYLSVPDRYYAAWILWRIGTAAEPARCALRNCQMDESGCVREMVARALVKLQEPLSNVLPPLMHGLHSPEMSHRERMRIAETMHKLGSPHEEFLPVVLDVLHNSQDFTAMSYALDVVEDVGSAASVAVPEIERLIHEHPKREGLRRKTARVLHHMGHPSAVTEAILSAAGAVNEVE